MVPFQVRWQPRHGVSVVCLDQHAKTPISYRFPGRSFTGRVLHASSGRAHADAFITFGAAGALAAVERARGGASIEHLTLPVFVVLWMRGPRHRRGGKVFDAFVTHDSEEAAGLVRLARNGGVGAVPSLLWPEKWRVNVRTQRDYARRKVREAERRRVRPVERPARRRAVEPFGVLLEGLDDVEQGPACPQCHRRMRRLFVREVRDPRNARKASGVVVQDTCAACRWGEVRLLPVARKWAAALKAAHRDARRTIASHPGHAPATSERENAPVAREAKAVGARLRAVH